LVFACFNSKLGANAIFVSDDGFKLAYNMDLAKIFYRATESSAVLLIIEDHQDRKKFEFGLEPVYDNLYGSGIRFTDMSSPYKSDIICNDRLNSRTNAVEHAIKVVVRGKLPFLKSGARVQATYHKKDEYTKLDFEIPLRYEEILYSRLESVLQPLRQDMWDMSRTTPYF
jgi:hypothetical protein